MRKTNKGFVLAAIAAAVMMTATACGSSNKETPTTGETVESTEATEANGQGDDAEDEETEQETFGVKEAENAGKIDDSGKFAEKSGKYEITLPEGWLIDSGSDDEVAVFTSPDGSDFIEITYLTGESADSEKENLPETADEFKEYVARGAEEIEITRYDVEKSENGDETFHYAIKFLSADAEQKYTEASGSYKADGKEYVIALATVESEGDEIIKTINTTMDSFKVLK